MIPLSGVRSFDDVNDRLNYINSLKVSDFAGTLGTSRVSGLVFLSPTISPAIVAANTTAEQTFTVAGLAAGATVVVNKPTAQAGLGIVGFRAVSANTLGITFSNNTGAGITPTASEKYLVVAISSL